ncbi:MAG: hypothetical protein KGZ39_01035 [Simkania sp.]|nr:hypothetical protein [Simkania sp.]
MALSAEVDTANLPKPQGGGSGSGVIVEPMPQKNSKADKKTTPPTDTIIYHSDAEQDQAAEQLNKAPQSGEIYNPGAGDDNKTAKKPTKEMEVIRGHTNQDQTEVEQESVPNTSTVLEFTPNQKPSPGEPQAAPNSSAIIEPTKPPPTSTPPVAPNSSAILDTTKSPNQTDKSGSSIIFE